MEWAEYTKLIVKKCKDRSIPLSATFELTPYCNFNCNMCYIHLTEDQAKKQGSQLSTDQWIHIAEETKQLGTLGLEITGGEAVTRPDFPFLYEAFINMGFLVSLRSNGYLLKGKLLKLLSNYKPRSVHVTLYGGSDETYYKVCGISNGFTEVTKNILALKDSGILPKLTMTMTRDNISDRDKILEWAKNNNLFISLYGGLITPIRSAKRSIDHLKINFNGEQTYRNYQDNELIIRKVCNREKYEPPFWMCTEFGTRYCITWDGRMTLCNCLPSIWSDPLTQGVNNAFIELNKKLNDVKRPAKCTDCSFIDYCAACPSRFLSETGDYEETCESLCEKARIRFLKANAKQVHTDNMIDNDLC